MSDSTEGYTDHVDGHYVYRDVNFMRTVFPQETLDYVKDKFQFKDTDIVVASYPKTGTTWTQEIIWQLMNRADPDGVSREIPITTRFPFLEIAEELPETSGIELAEAMTSPRLIKSHLPIQFLPDNIKKTKIIFVTRDVRDVFVSYYHHTHGFVPYKFIGTLDNWFTMWKNRTMVYGDFFDYHLGWYQFGKGRDNVFFTTYEALKVKPRQAISDIAEFIGVDVTDEEFLDKVVHNSSFKSMKDNPAINGHHNKQPDMIRGNFQFIREGASLGRKRSLTPEQAEFFNHEIEEFKRKSCLPYLYTSKDYGL